MQPIKFEGVNCQIPLLGNMPCKRSIEQGVETFTFAFKPSEEDLKSLKEGMPLILTLARQVSPFIICTIDKEGKPNYETEKKA
jgi:hypothetical protein